MMKKRGTVLHLCCGKSRVGNYLADASLEHHPDIVCDIRNAPFKPGSVDTLIVDPPFSMYNRFKWIYKLAEIPRYYMLLSTPMFLPSIRGFSKQPEATVQRGNLVVRVWGLYTKKNKILEDCNEIL